MKRVFTYLMASMIILGAYTNSQAQGCSDLLFEANRMYQDGNVLDAIDILELCIPTKKDKDELFAAYKLLAIAYQNVEDDLGMRRAIERMLLLRPSYLKFPSNDPIDFRKEVEQYRVRPSLSVGFQMGYNSSWVKLKESYTSLQYPQKYVPQDGFQFGIQAINHFNSTTSARVRMEYVQMSLRMEVDEEDVWSNVYREDLGLWNFTLGLGQDIVNAGPNTLGLNGGLGFGFRVMSRGRLSSENLLTGGSDFSSSRPGSQRKAIQPQLDVSLQYMRDMGKFSIGGEIGHRMFLSNAVKPDKRYDDLDFVWGTTYAADNYSFRQFYLSLTITAPYKSIVEKAK